jgi:hypothetical protein
MNRAKKTWKRFSHVQKVHQEDYSTPGLRKQFPHRGRFQFCEEGTPMDTPEMADVPVPIQLFGNDRETCRLL